MSAEEVTWPKYPDVVVTLTGENGNALVLIGKVRRALRRAGVAGPELEAFFEEATSGDYDNVIATCMRWVEVE